MAQCSDMNCICYRILLAILGIAMLPGCVQMPVADKDIAWAIQSADVQGRLDLLRRQGELIAGIPFSGNNSIHLLRDGQESVTAMETAISGARLRVDMESYIFDEIAGSDFAELLIAARHRGVEVHLLYDAWGSLGTSDALFDRMRDAGVRIVEFNPITATAVVENLLDKRDHRKLLVVDDMIAFTGSLNISDVYRRHFQADDPPGDPDKQPWRDTDIRVEGPAVLEFERSFEQVWKEQGGPDLTPPSEMTSVQDRGPYLQVISNIPTLSDHAIYRSLLVAISLARRSVHLTTGFFAPPPGLVRALRRSARRGVDVVLLVPSRSSSTTAIRAGRAYYEALLKSGVRIYEFQGRVLHAKTAVIDGEWSSVGSANLDWRSVTLNNEIDAVILSESFGREMEAMFSDDLSAARRIDPLEWRHRPLSEKAGEWTARLFEDFL